MPKLTREHFEAIDLSNQLLDCVSDTVQAAANTAVATGQWEWKKRGKSSVGAIDGGRCLWIAPLVLKGKDHYLQVGAYFGVDCGKPSVRAAILLTGEWPKVAGQAREERTWWGQRALMFRDIAPSFLTLQAADEDPLDSMKREIEQTLEALANSVVAPDRD